MRELARLSRIGDVENAEAVIEIAWRLTEVAHRLVIDDHQIAGRSDLVRMGVVRQPADLGDTLRIAWVAHIDDGRADRPLLMADIGIVPVDDDLAAAITIEPRQRANALGFRHPISSLQPTITPRLWKSRAKSAYRSVLCHWYRRSPSCRPSTRRASCARSRRPSRSSRSCGRNRSSARSRFYRDWSSPRRADRSPPCDWRDR